MHTCTEIRPGCIVRGPMLAEPIEVLATVPMGESLKVIGRGTQTGMTHDPILTPQQLAELTVSAEQEPFDGDARLFRLGVEAQSIMAAQEGSARGRAVGFTMAMLQRRMASSVYAVRRTLERMRDRREKILADPEAYRQEQIQRRMPDDFDELTEEEQQKIVAQLEDEVLSVDPAILREEIAQLGKLVEHAKALEERDVESKHNKLREVLNTERIFTDPKMKLIVFTEHKDTLDYLAGDGEDGRPLGKLRQWGLTIAQIHGGMKIGDRDTKGSRIYAEREFRESAQVLVATVAAGEGINLQFCWLMINFDIPWNPVRLEQRVGRIHRYGQEKDCLVINFVAQNTREGRVLTKLLDRLKEIRNDLGTDQVFDVVGEVFPSNRLENLLRQMYARQTDEHRIQEQIVKDVSPERFRAITESALEGLAKRELNLSAIVGRSAEAKERRLVPEVVEQFFAEAAPEVGLRPKPLSKGSHVYRVGKVPRRVVEMGNRQENRYGRIGRDYGKIVFDKKLLTDDPTLEWVTPGHALFEAIRAEVLLDTEPHLGRGAVFYDLHRKGPALLDVFGASIKDGRGNVLHRRLFIVETTATGGMLVREPTVFHDITPAPAGAVAPGEEFSIPSRQAAEQLLYEQTLHPCSEDPKTFIEVRFIEVKGRAGVGVVALSENEYRTAERLQKDYWLYAVFNCAGTPELHPVRDPARLGWQPVVTVEHYAVDARALMGAEEKAV